MSDNIDFKGLWNREETSIPDVTEIFKKAAKFNRRIRVRIWFENITLSIVLITFLGSWWFENPQEITTKIGLVLMVIAIISFLIASNLQFPLLANADVQTDSRQFLITMIRIKQKQEFLNTTMLTAYFILLIVGIGLYFIEPLRRASVLKQVLTYTLTFAAMAFAWFYISPRTIKKQRNAISAIITKLEAVNSQLE